MSEALIGTTTLEVNESAQISEPDWKTKYEETIAESRKWEQRAKENKSAAEKLAELEEASKTAEQKQAERLAELESQVSEYKTRDQVNEWKTEIVKDSHIAASLLRGSTREELESHFIELKSAIPDPTVQGDPAATRYTIPTEGSAPSMALNGDGIENALKKALGI